MLRQMARSIMSPMLALVLGANVALARAPMDEDLHPGELFTTQSAGKGGVEFKRGSLHDVLPSTRQEEATVTVLVVSAVMAVSVMTATPLKLNPPLGAHQGGHATTCFLEGFLEGAL